MEVSGDDIADETKPADAKKKPIRQHNIKNAKIGELNHLSMLFGRVWSFMDLLDKSV